MYTERKDGWIVVKVEGSLNLKVAKQIQNELEEALETGEKSVLFDLSRTDNMDSSGLGVLIDTKERLDEISGECIIAGLRGHCRELFRMTRLDEQFTLRESLA